MAHCSNAGEKLGASARKSFIDGGYSLGKGLQHENVIDCLLRVLDVGLSRTNDELNLSAGACHDQMKVQTAVRSLSASRNPLRAIEQVSNECFRWRRSSRLAISGVKEHILLSAKLLHSIPSMLQETLLSRRLKDIASKNPRAHGRQCLVHKAEQAVLGFDVCNILD